MFKILTFFNTHFGNGYDCAPLYEDITIVGIPA